jgi:hypothetical protein
MACGLAGTLADARLRGADPVRGGRTVSGRRRILLCDAEPRSLRALRVVCQTLRTLRAPPLRVIATSTAHVRPNLAVLRTLTTSAARTACASATQASSKVTSPKLDLQ